MLSTTFSDSAGTSLADNFYLNSVELVKNAHVRPQPVDSQILDEANNFLCDVENDLQAWYSMMDREPLLPVESRIEDLIFSIYEKPLSDARTACATRLKLVK